MISNAREMGLGVAMRTPMVLARGTRCMRSVCSGVLRGDVCLRGSLCGQTPVTVEIVASAIATLAS
jgi:hypothetical protein